MSATAAHQPDEGDPCLAPVVSLSSRRDVKAAGSVVPGTADEELQEQAARHWSAAFKSVGADLGSPEALLIVPLITKELERLIGGLLVIREGREDLPANPDAGVDLTSAVELTGILRDLALAVKKANDQRR